MIERIENREKGIPWFLHDKLKCYRFCEENGLATVTVLREFDVPGDICLDGLPSDYVIKPTLQSSTKGVMVVHQGEAGLWDSMQRKFVTEQDILELQTDMFEQTKAFGKKVIVEAKISDVAGCDIPRDFKAYCFQGEVALILEINRNSKPSQVSWYDGEFRPVFDDRVTSNPEFVNEIIGSKPEAWAEILDLAKRTSAAVPTPFASIDMYSTPQGPIVGEITLAPGGLFHGKHYTLSPAQQSRMGAQWMEAADILRPDSTLGRLNGAAQLAYGKHYRLLSPDEQFKVAQICVQEKSA